MNKEQLIEKYKSFITKEKLERFINVERWGEGYASFIVLSDIKIDNIDYDDIFLEIKKHISSLNIGTVKVYRYYSPDDTHNKYFYVKIEYFYSSCCIII